MGRLQSFIKEKLKIHRVIRFTIKFKTTVVSGKNKICDFRSELNCVIFYFKTVFTYFSDFPFILMRHILIPFDAYKSRVLIIITDKHKNT